MVHHVWRAAISPIDDDTCRTRGAAGSVRPLRGERVLETGLLVDQRQLVVVLEAVRVASACAEGCGDGHGLGPDFGGEDSTARVGVGEVGVGVL